MADNTTPARPMASTFLQTVKQGEVWKHNELGKVRISGVIRDAKTEEIVSLQLLPLQPDGMDIENIPAFAAKIEKKHITEKRLPRKFVRYRAA